VYASELESVWWNIHENPAAILKSVVPKFTEKKRTKKQRMITGKEDFRLT
jgi:hypothetical protein